MQSDLDAAKGEITKLTDEQVANIQNNIAQEEQHLATVQPETLQKSEENQPLVDTANAEENPSLSPAEIAEQAELDESQFAAYYPPDDGLASPTSSQQQDKQNVS